MKQSKSGAVGIQNNNTFSNKSNGDGSNIMASFVQNMESPDSNQ
jgi:hypothetical protein